MQTTNEDEIKQTMKNAFKTLSNLKAREFWGGLP